MNGIKCIGLLVAYHLLAYVNGAGQSCQDVDHDACVAMATQNANMCMDPTLSKSVCPSYCHKCPITCYQCNVSTYDVGSCNTVTCGAGEACMLKEVRSTRNGKHTFSLACSSKERCDGERKRSIQYRSFRVDCCTDDLCNRPVLPTITPTSLVTSPVTPSPPTLFNSVCTRDILFMVERTVGFVSHYPGIGQFLTQFVGGMKHTDSADQISVALATFQTKVDVQWPYISNWTTLLQNFQSFKSIPTVSSQAQSYNPAVSLTQIGSEHIRNRPNVSDVLIIITGSDVVTQDAKSLQTVTNFLHGIYNNVVALGIGSVDPKYLSTVATESSHAFVVSKEAGLFSNLLWGRLLNIICS